MKRFTLRMPETLHMQLLAEAGREGVPINKWILTRISLALPPLEKAVCTKVNPRTHSRCGNYAFFPSSQVPDEFVCARCSQRGRRKNNE